MLRRAPTVLQVTAEDIADYEDRRIAEYEKQNPHLATEELYRGVNGRYPQHVQEPHPSSRNNLLNHLHRQQRITANWNAARDRFPRGSDSEDSAGGQYVSSSEDEDDDDDQGEVEDVEEEEEGQEVEMREEESTMDVDLDESSLALPLSSSPAAARARATAEGGRGVARGAGTVAGHAVERRAVRQGRITTIGAGTGGGAGGGAGGTMQTQSQAATGHAAGPPTNVVTPEARPARSREERIGIAQGAPERRRRGH